jgi:hypothetical protein
MKLLSILLVLTALACNSYASSTINGTDTTGYVIVSKKKAISPIGAHIKIKATLHSSPNTVPYGLVDKSGKLVFLTISDSNGKIDFQLWGGDFLAVRVSLIGYTTVDIPLKDLYGSTVEINVNLMDTPINDYD